jgi:oligosaccharide repeat unit polymerase
MELLVYLLHISVALALIITSIAYTRRITHPYTLFCVLVVALLMSDFAIRGYSAETTGDVSTEYVYELQLLIIGLSTAICVVAFALNRSDRASPPSAPVLLPRRFAKVAASIAWSIVILEVIKRLYFSDWSVTMALMYSIGPRGSAPWLPRAGELGNLGDEKIFLAPTIILMPLAGMLFGYLGVLSNKRRALSFAGLLITVTILVADGGRTPVVAVLGTTALVVLIHKRPSLRTYVGLAIVALLIAASTSVMFHFRSEGLVQLIEETAPEYQLTYHQDDNYRQALLSLERSLTTSERWDPWTFAYVIAVNPIPRALWPTKPALLADYWGNYKNEWTTITFVGELVAMFGFFGGLIASVIIAICVFQMISRAYRLVDEHGGVIVYLLIALYGYMVLRSLLNITQFIYLPAAALLIYGVLKLVLNRARSGNERPN